MPLGTDPVALTVAVSVTVCAKTDGLGDEFSVVLVPAGLTCSDRPEDVLPWKFPPPAYAAVIVCVPTDSVDVARAAWPPFSVLVPKAVFPS